MKCVIMAGGAGTRGRPYTDHIPKAMIRAGGKPIVEIVARYVSASPHIDGIVVVADLAGTGAQIRNYLECADLGVPVTFVQDASRGTGGDVVSAQDHVSGTKFLLWFSDNLCAVDIDAMIRTHAESARHACVAVRSRRKEETGFVKTVRSQVTEFVEKPVIDLPMQECLGVYVLDSHVVEAIRRKAARNPKVDLSYDILADFAARSQLSAYDIGRTEWLDVESPVVLDRNSDAASHIMAQMRRRVTVMRLAASRAQRPRSRRRTRV